MAVERTLLERAKAGDVEAIATLMNRTLNKQSRHVRVLRKASQLKLLVESTEAPPQATTVGWIEKGLSQLAIANIETAIVYGKSKQGAKPTWQQTICFNAVEPVAEESATASEPPLDLSKYCFTRNKSLLVGDLTLPSKPVIQLVLTFSTLTNEQKLEALPLLDKVLRNPQFAIEDTLSDSAKDWLAKISKLEGPEVRKASIWMSRYCVETAATVEQLDHKSAPETTENNEPEDTTVAPANALESADAHRSKQPFPSTHQPRPVAKTTDSSAAGFSESAGSSALFATGSLIPSWVVPAVWVLFLTISLGLGISKASNAYYGYPVCENALGAPETCSLAVEIAGDEEFISEVVADAKPITPEIKEKAVERCSNYGYTEVTSVPPMGTSIRPSREEAISILTSSTEEVLPGIFVTDVTQTDSNAENVTTRFACVGYSYAFQDLSGGASSTNYPKEMNGKIMYKSLGSDVIPMEWPAEPYSGLMELVHGMEKVASVYNVFVRFGANTLFAAVGLFVAVLFCSSYSCQTLGGLYQAAFIMGAFETLLPFGGYSIRLAVVSLGLGIASMFIKGFRVDWSEGYYSVAMGAGIVVFIRFMLSVLLYIVVSGLVVG